METKKCGSCGRVLCVSSFSKLSRNKDGLNCTCRDCRKIICNRYKEKNIDLYLERSRESRKRCYYKNIDESRKYSREQYWKFRDDRIDRGRKYREGNPEKVKLTQKIYREKNKEKIRNRKKKEYVANQEMFCSRTKEYYKKHKDEKREYNRKYNKENPENCRERANLRRARERAVKYETVNATTIFERDGYICWICGKKINPRLKSPHPKSKTLDHIIPLSKRGTHTMSNIQSAHRQCNTSKSNKIKGQMILDIF